MPDSGWMVLLFILLPMIALMIFIFALFYDKKDYDERQRQVQGRAYAAAYFVLLGFTMGVSLVQLMAEREWLNTLSVVCIGMVLSMLVHSLICICGDAYFKISAKMKIALPATGLLVVLYIVQALLDGKPLLRDGQLSSGALELMLAAYYVIVVAAYGLRQLYNRRRERE